MHPVSRAAGMISFALICLAGICPGSVSTVPDTAIAPPRPPQFVTLLASAIQRAEALARAPLAAGDKAQAVAERKKEVQAILDGMKGQVVQVSFVADGTQPGTGDVAHVAGHLTWMSDAQISAANQEKISRLTKNDDARDIKSASSLLRPMQTVVIYSRYAQVQALQPGQQGAVVAVIGAVKVTYYTAETEAIVNGHQTKSTAPTPVELGDTTAPQDIYVSTEVTLTQ